MTTTTIIIIIIIIMINSNAIIIIVSFSCNTTIIDQEEISCIEANFTSMKKHVILTNEMLQCKPCTKAL